MIDIEKNIAIIEKNAVAKEKNISEIEKAISELEKSLENANVIQNGSFEFDEKQLRPTFVFKEGLPGNSFAFFLAKEVGLSSLVLSRAKQHLGGRQKQLEKSISVLQNHKKEYDSLILECRKEQINIEKIKKEYENKKKELTNKKEKIINDAKLEADKILSSAAMVVETTIKELRETKKNELDIKKEFKAEQERLSKEAARIKTEQVVKNKDVIIAEVLAVNDVVGMLDSSGEGVVLESNDIEKTALVAFNGLKFRLPYSQLYLKENKKQTKKIKIAPIKLDVRTKLDLRGYRVEEALQETEKFIYQALQRNAFDVSIIHGKGTGVLREVIHNYLKTIPEIKSFRLGEQYEGGSGATFVYFV